MLQRGVYPAAVTPMTAKGEGLDRDSLARLLTRFESAGCAGALLAGTNGEGPSLSIHEKLELLMAARACSRLDFILGIATASSSEAVELCEGAGSAGAVAGLVMPPAYFRDVTDEGLEAWFLFVLDRSPLPVLIYNFPQRTGIALGASLLARLACHPRCAGAKDSSGNAENLTAFAAAMPGKRLYVGDETLLLAALDAGWSGAFSGAANLLAGRLAKLVASYGAGDRSDAAKTFGELKPQLQELRSCRQPATNKARLFAEGVLTTPCVRPPLTTEIAVSNPSA
ncbi:MAG: dihydrodipicolinate synthase family protein [Fimbriimonadaceae bacterium]